MVTKQEVRKEMLQKRNAISKELIEVNSRKIAEKVINLEEYQKAEAIYIYMNMEKESETSEIILHALNNSKKVAIPKIESNKIVFYEIQNICDTVIGYFGVREPISKKIAEYENVLVIMPGVAFDYKKHRIGYGKGFYDEYLNKNTKYPKIALGFSFQILEEIPYDTFDILPDKIITEKEIIS